MQQRGTFPTLHHSGTEPSPPQTMEEFRALLAAQKHLREKRSVESEEEEDFFYRSKEDYSGKWLFSWLNPANPTRARLRVERIYWVAWKPFLYGFFMSGVGIMLMAVGLGCASGLFCEERSRGVVVLFGSLLICIPGFYSLFVLLMYVRCRKGYSYTQLPEG